MKYEFTDKGVDLSFCRIDCAELSDEEIWQLVLKFFMKLDSPNDSHLWPRWKNDILNSNELQPLLCGGYLDIGLVNTGISRELKIRTHGSRCDQKVLDRFKEAVGQILNP